MRTTLPSRVAILVSVITACLCGVVMGDPGPALHSNRPSPLFSVVSVSGTTVPVGSAISVRLTARNSHGEMLTDGGLNVVFTLPTPAGAGAGAFSDVMDNLDGTYTASFTGKVAGAAAKIGVTINGNIVVNSPLPTVLVTPASSLSGSAAVPPTPATASPATTGSTGAAGTTTGSAGTGSTGTAGTTTISSNTGTTTGSKGGTGSTGTTTGSSTTGTIGMVGTTTGSGSTGSTGTTGTTTASSSTGSTSTAGTTTGASSAGSTGTAGTTPGSNIPGTAVAANGSGSGAGYALAVPPQDANGWTIIPLLQSGQAYYVSSSTGKDSNNGLSPATPKATILAGVAMLRNGFGDHLLLKCGDVFTAGQAPAAGPFIGYWAISGASRTDPIVISSYGSAPGLARPQLKTGASPSIVNTMNPGTRSDVWWIGLDFYCDYNDPANLGANTPVGSTAFFLLDQVNDWMWEDCRFQYYGTGLVVEPNKVALLTDIRVHRCQVLNSYNLGTFMGGVTNLLIDQNTFDHNGWNTGLTAGVDDPSVFKHNVYIDPASNFSLTGNIISNGSNYGLLYKGEAAGAEGGLVGPSVNSLISGNLFLGNANDMEVGIDQDTTGTALQQNSTVQGNIFTETGRVVGGADQSCGVVVESGQNVIVQGNFFINKPDTGASFCVSLQARGGISQSNVTVTGNVCAGWVSATFLFDPTMVTNTTVANNPIDAPASTYLDAARTIGTYDTTLGGPGSSADFISQARLQSKAAWSPNLTANGAVRYLTTGFTVAWMGP